MTGQQAIDLLMQRLGNRTDVATRARCLSEMILAQETLENGPMLPWFLVSEDATTNTNVNERRVVLPTDFLREHDEGELLVQDTDGGWLELHKNDYDLLIDKYGFLEAGDPPVEYAIVGLYFCLFPIPTVQRTLRLSKYYGRDLPPVDGATVNRWLRFAPDLLIATAGVIVASLHLRDNEAAGILDAIRITAMSRLEKENTAREEANRMRQMGED